MPHVVLTEEQMRVLRDANGPVDVRDAQGLPVASLSLLTPEEVEVIAEAKRRLQTPGPRIPSERVRAMLHKFEEIRQAEGINRVKMEEVLRRVVAGEPL